MTVLFCKRKKENNCLLCLYGCLPEMHRQRICLLPVLQHSLVKVTLAIFKLHHLNVTLVAFGSYVFSLFFRESLKKERAALYGH